MVGASLTPTQASAALIALLQAAQMGRVSAAGAQILIAAAAAIAGPLSDFVAAADERSQGWMDADEPFDHTRDVLLDVQKRTRRPCGPWESATLGEFVQRKGALSGYEFRKRVATHAASGPRS
jgi:hypothetical protein